MRRVSTPRCAASISPKHPSPSPLFGENHTITILPFVSPVRPPITL